MLIERITTSARGLICARVGPGAVDREAVAAVVA
jgi:hypothetical protein